MPGPRPYAFDRAKMLTGAAASFQTTSAALGSSGQPASCPPTSTAPPCRRAARPTTSSSFGSPLKVYKFHVDWTTPANTTWTNSANLAPAAFTELCSDRANCMPSPAPQLKLDGIGDRVMFRLAYRNFGDHEALVYNHSVNVGGSQAGVRWYEIRNPSTTATIFQQGTYAARQHQPLDGQRGDGPPGQPRHRLQRLQQHRLPRYPLRRAAWPAIRSATAAGRGHPVDRHRLPDRRRQPLGRLQRPDRRPQRRLHLLVHATSTTTAAAPGTGARASARSSSRSCSGGPPPTPTNTPAAVPTNTPTRTPTNTPTPSGRPTRQLAPRPALLRPPGRPIPRPAPRPTPPRRSAADAAKRSPMAASRAAPARGSRPRPMATSSLTPPARIPARTAPTSAATTMRWTPSMSKSASRLQPPRPH